MSQRLTVDWFQILSDLKRGGLSTYDVSALIDVPKATLMGWKNAGSEPRYSVGERLVVLWCERQQRSRDELPRAAAPFSAAQAKRLSGL